MADWEEEVQHEFERADLARARGNEGQARVCARRATGIAIREYYTILGRLIRTQSAYDLLNLLINDPQMDLEIKQSAAYLTMRVSEEFKLPAGVDLLDEARKLIDGLLAD